MEGSGKWITSGIIVFVGILGLIAASRAADGAFYYGGFIVFIVSVAYIFITVGRYYDRVEAERHSHEGH